MLKSSVAAALGCIALLGCRPEGAAPATRDAAALTFGDRQLAQVLADRPDMRGVVPLDSPVAQWIVAGFNGERLGQRVYWNANSPRSGRGAEHAGAYGPYPPYISITGGTEETPRDKWAALVFEFFNMENAEQWESLQCEVLTGTMSGDEFAVRSVQIEWLAVKQTAEFFRANPLPPSSHGRDTWYVWVTKDIDPADFDESRPLEEVEKKYREHSNYKYFLDYYESSIAPYASYLQQQQDAGVDDDDDATTAD